MLGSWYCDFLIFYDIWDICQLKLVVVSFLILNIHFYLIYSILVIFIFAFKEGTITESASGQSNSCSLSWNMHLLCKGDSKEEETRAFT